MYVKLRLGRFVSPVISFKTFSKSRMLVGKPIFRAACVHISREGIIASIIDLIASLNLVSLPKEEVISVFLRLLVG